MGGRQSESGACWFGPIGEQHKRRSQLVFRTYHWQRCLLHKNNYIVSAAVSIHVVLCLAELKY